MEIKHNADAQLLLADITGKSREFLFAHPEFQPPLLERLSFHRLLKKRRRGVPLAYLTGHKEFYGLDFLVNKHTLIPRPETELIVELTTERIKELKNCGIEHITLIDIGTGTGCIPIAIMQTLKHENIKTFATDISRPALRIAKKNAERHKIDIQFLRGDIFQPIRKLKIGNCKLIITANLPYLTAEQFNSESSIQHEPRSALVADKNGLALYEKLLKQINSIIPQFHNSSLSVFFEIDPSQSTPMKALIKAILPMASVEIKTDLRGQDRVVHVETTN